MSNSHRNRSQPLSIRFTDDERARLLEKAGSIPLGTYIRSVVLDQWCKAAARGRRQPVRDGDALGRVLGLLGSSRLANNLNQLAKAANQGALPVTEEIEADIRQACADIRAMRHALMLALGITAQDSPPSAAEAFLRHAGGPAG